MFGIKQDVPSREVDDEELVEGLVLAITGSNTMNRFKQAKYREDVFEYLR